MRLLRGFILLTLSTLVLEAAHPTKAECAYVTMTLHWTTPGDDGLHGHATHYDIRYSKSPINAANFSRAMMALGTPYPEVAGVRDSFTVAGLMSGTGYYFAIRTVDDANNWSPISNVAYHPPVNILGVEDGLAPVALAFSEPSPNPAHASVRFAYALPHAGPVELVAFDVAGRHVRSIASGTREAGRGDLGWDLRDDSGQRVRPGVYLVHARMAGSRWVKRVIVAG